jgi:hypothetical protein
MRRSRDPERVLAMPRFADYHRTVIGYHGTQRSTALRVVQGLEGYKRSENADDWLGHGIYFWEYAPKQAWAWAEQRRKTWNQGEDVAVLASMIRLGNCFDLLDPDNLEILARFRREYERREREEGGSRGRTSISPSTWTVRYSSMRTLHSLPNGIPWTPAGQSSSPPTSGSGHGAACTATPTSNCVSGTPTVYWVRGSSNRPRIEPMTTPIFKAPDVPMSVKMERALAAVKRMTYVERLQLLVRAGLMTAAEAEDAASRPPPAKKPRPKSRTTRPAPAKKPAKPRGARSI